jgi:hypothetical protein
LHLYPFGIAQLHAPRLRGGKRGFGALADRLTFLLGHQRHDPDREPIGVRHVDCDELDARLLKSKKEVRVAAQPVELGDDELCVVGAAGVDGFVESRPIIGAFAAFDLDMLFDKLPSAAVQPCFD